MLERLDATSAFPDHPEAGAFVLRLLAVPNDVVTRLVFADWLDDHGLGKRAHYLRSVRVSKFVRLVRRRGEWAMFPEHLFPMPPKVKDKFQNGNNVPAFVSDRLQAWHMKLCRGWRPPKHIRRAGYSGRAGYYGVHVSEQLHILDSWLEIATSTVED